MCMSAFYYRRVRIIRNILYLLGFTTFLLVGCQNPNDHSAASNIDLDKQQGIIEKYLVDSARQYSYYSKEWQKYIDMGLQEDSTIAYLWQQKAMPLFKQGKYELGMQYLDKAVYYDRSRWLNYRAFIKCIFAKTYRAAITDF